MRAVVQRVKSSSVSIGGKEISSIRTGMNVLLGITQGDTIEDILYLKDKIINLRIFEDEQGKMNRSLKDIQGELLIVSQFTLYGDCRRGRRPSFINALSGEQAEVLYNDFIKACLDEGIKIGTGVFGADMNVKIENDGPVTILLDSKKTF